MPWPYPWSVAEEWPPANGSQVQTALLGAYVRQPGNGVEPWDIVPVNEAMAEFPPVI